MYPNDTTLFDRGTAELLVVTVLRLWAAGCGDAAAPITWSAPVVRRGWRKCTGVGLAVAAAAHRALDIREHPCRGSGVTRKAAAVAYPAAARSRLGSVGDAGRLAVACRDADRSARRRYVGGNPGLAALIVAPRYAETAALPRLAACTHATRGLALLQ